MGKKVSPISLRIGITRTWDSKWYAKRDYKKQFLQDLSIRKYIEKNLAKAGISKIEIIRSAGKVLLTIHTPKPGMIVGRGGEAIGELQKTLTQKFGEVFDVKVQEVRKPDADAKLIAENIAEQISKRFPYRRVAKMALERAMEAGVKGIKVKIGGRLNGVDIARNETYSSGTVPLHTLRANIEYHHAEADTMYGIIGVKVWVYTGLVFKNQSLNALN